MKKSKKYADLKSRYTKEQMEEAVKIVNEMIEAECEAYQIIAETSGLPPVKVSGMTDNGLDCIVQMDPSKIAEILLEHDFHIWKFIKYYGDDGSMWKAIAELCGLFDLYEDVDMEKSKEAIAY